MQINDKKYRLSKLQRLILETLKNGKYSYMDRPLNAKFRNFYSNQNGNIDELRSQVSKAYNDGTDKKSLFDSTFHYHTQSFSASFTRALHNLEQKGLVSIYYYNELPSLKWRQHKKCEGKEPLDDCPCQECPMIIGHEFRIFFVDDKNKCIAQIVDKSERRAHGKKRPTIFTVFLTERASKHSLFDS